MAQPATHPLIKIVLMLVATVFGIGLVALIAALVWW